MDAKPLPRDELARLTAAGMSAKALAVLFGVHPLTVHRWRKRYGISVPRKQGAH